MSIADDVLAGKCPPFDAATRLELAREVCAKIVAAEIWDEPFPYLVVNQFLPGSFYKALLASWPGEAVFAARNHQLRLQINLARELQAIDPAAQALWGELVHLSEAINRALYEKFAPYVSRKFVPLFGRNWRDMARKYRSSFREVQLAQYDGKAGLHPHVDSVRLIVNSFLYASERDASEPALGTVLYRSFGFMTTENNVKLSAKLQERVLKRDTVIPYAPNRLLSFVNTPFSFHGVDDFDIGERRRRVILLSPLINQTVEEIEADFQAKAPHINEGAA